MPRLFTTLLLSLIRNLYSLLYYLMLDHYVLHRLLSHSQPLLIPQVPSVTRIIHPGYFFPAKSALQPEGLHHTRGIAGSGLPPSSKIPHCCLPSESAPCLSPRVAGRPLRPATDPYLGEPLPHQLANP